MPQEDGTKSRARLVTTMTKRSSHMPTFTTIETKNSSGIFCRTLRRPQQLRNQDIAEDQHPEEERSTGPWRGS